MNRNVLANLEDLFGVRQTAAFRDYMGNLQTNLKQNPSTFWSYVKNRKKNNGIPTELQYEDHTANNAEESADLFAQFFKSVFNSAPVGNANPVTTTAYDLNLPFRSISHEEVRSTLKDLDVTKGAGTDGLTPKFLKECSSTLIEPLTYIFNRSLRDGVFPDLWKIAFIVPIHKSGSRHKADNYRGISILNSIPKVFEKVMHNIFYTACQQLISEHQHGFVKKRSTTSNLMCLTTFLMQAIENRQQVDAVYIDFAKAFDKVPHARVAQKLSQLGFPAWAVNWLNSYLIDRKAFVRLGTTRSQSFTTSSGVPQGSILGPLIFILFVNDLCSRLKSYKLMFADDLKIFRTIHSRLDCAALQADLVELEAWCLENGMEVNVKKTKVITFSRRQSLLRFDYVLCGNELDRVDSIRDLGVIMDDKLRFDEHISATTAKAFSVIGFLRRNTSDFNDIDALKALYCALVRSILEHSVAVWAPYHNVQTQRIEKVQRSFVRYAVFKTNPLDDSSYADRCLRLDLETLSSRRTKLRRVFVFDLLRCNIDCPELLFKVGLRTPLRRLRNNSATLLHVPFHRTSYGYHDPLDASIRTFNETTDSFDFTISRETYLRNIRSVLG